MEFEQYRPEVVPSSVLCGLGAVLEGSIADFRRVFEGNFVVAEK